MRTCFCCAKAAVVGGRYLAELCTGSLLPRFLRSKTAGRSHHFGWWLAAHQPTRLTQRNATAQSRRFGTSSSNSLYQSFIMSEQSLLQRLQGADATRAAAAAIRGEPGNTTRAFTAERDLVQSWAAEHAELGTAADWRALESPADVVRCVEQAELPGAPYFMGLVFTFADARAAMRALDPDSVPSPLEVRDWAANMTRVHAGREPPEHAPGNTLAQTIAGFVCERNGSRP